MKNSKSVGSTLHQNKGENSNLTSHQNQNIRMFEN